MHRSFITIVSGLPRSGTSMMMRLLQAGGLEPLTDQLRAADEDNPHGYFELEPVKQLDQDASWLEVARGRAVKVISKLVPALPARYDYRVLFMRRNMQEILTSQRAMWGRRGNRLEAFDDLAMARRYDQHLRQITSWLAEQPNMQVLYVDYVGVLRNTAESLKRIDQFLGGGLDLGRMAGVVDHTLYRNRR